MRLRLLQALPNGDSGPLKDALTVQVRHSGFNDEDQKKIDTSTGDADDSVDTSADNNGVFDNAAFVTIIVDDRPRRRIPVPLLNDQPVTIAVNVAADSLLQSRKADWERHVDAAWQVQNQLFKEINDLSAKPDKRAETMKKIDEAIQQSRDDYDRLNKEHDELAKEAGPLNAPSTLDRLAKLREGGTELQGFLDKLKKIEASENDPKRKEWRARVDRASGWSRKTWKRPSPSTRTC